jgi:RNA polymerase sigma factor (sigma-70 family)
MGRYASRSDEQLLAAAAGGDDAAFAAFYRRYVDSIVKFFMRRVADPELAFDLTFQSDRAPAVAWLYGIATNKLRESLRRRRVEVAARERLRLDPVAIVDADIERIEEIASSALPGLDDLVAALHEEQRDAIQARVVEEREYAEIAAELQCSAAVVRQRVHRGLTRLRRGVEELP